MLLGRQGGERILAEEVARRLGTINYEVTSGLTPGAPTARAVKLAQILAGTEAWVGRDRSRRVAGPLTSDVDLALAGDPEPAARAVAAAVRGPVFRLSEGSARGGSSSATPGGCTTSHRCRASPSSRIWRCGTSVNAMARPLKSDELIDPVGGRADLAERRLRVLGREAYERDPPASSAARALCRAAGLRGRPGDRAPDRRGSAARAAGRRRARVQRAGCSWRPAFWTGSTCRSPGPGAVGPARAG